MTRRVVAAMTGLVAFAVLLFALPLAIAIEHRQQDQDRRELTQVAALAASRVDAGRLDTFGPSSRLEREQEIGLYDPAGRRVGGRGPARLEASIIGVLGDRVVEHHGDRNLVTAVPVVGAGGVDGAIRASESLAAGRARVRAAWAQLGLLAGLAVLIALLGALLLARRLTRPLAALADAAARIGDGDFTVDAEPTGLPEVDQVASALSATATRLSDLVAREHAFSADASHQLRSPLAGLRVTIESELAHPSSTPEASLGQALADVDRLERTIDELLALARETDRVRPPIDLGRTLDRLARRWEVPMADDRRRFVVEGATSLPAVCVSDAAVSHVLDVLVDNARRHGAGEVAVAARAHHDAVSVTVTDHGAGVAEPDALFARRHPGARGNGIGLALARRLAEAEGGRLILKENGPTTVFELTVPVGQSWRPRPAEL